MDMHALSYPLVRDEPASEPNLEPYWLVYHYDRSSQPAIVCSEGQMALAGPKPESDLNEQALIPVTPSGPRPRPIRENSRGDWRTELWKRQN